MTLDLFKKKTVILLRDKNFLLTAAFFAFIFCVFILNAPHERYPDEFDNILGGKYILQRKLIYADWFTHHGPIPYFLSAFLNIFSGNSFVHFRYLYAIFIFFITLGSYLFLRNRLKGTDTRFYLLLIFLLSIASTYFWGHMLLADSLSAYLLLPVFGLVVLKTINNRRFEMPDYVFISIFSSLAILSSLTYAFFVAGIFLYLFIYYFIREKKEFKILELLQIFLILVIPYLIFLLYLILTRSFDDYLMQAIKFNRDYYIYYPGWEGKPPSNPVRYAVLIAQGFHNNFSTLLISAKDFNFNYPFNITLGIANVCFGIYLLLKKKYLAFLFVLGSLIFTNARSSPLDSRETDYQSAVYIMISFFNLSYVLPQFYKEVNSNLEYGKKLIFTFLFILLLVYSFFCFTFLFRKFTFKVYNRYMGLSAGIYDGPKVSPYINRLVNPNSYSWIGPFAFEDLYYLNSKVPSKYHIYLPAMGNSQEIQQQFVSDFEKNKPDIIYFDKDFYILGKNSKEYGQPFLNFLKNNYILLSDFSEGELGYSDSVDRSFIFEEKLFLNKEKAGEIISRMDKEGMIKK